MNKIGIENVLELVTELGCEVKDHLKTYYQVVGKDKGKCLYIAKSKNFLTRVDCSGFVPSSHPSIKTLTPEDAKELKLGKVRGQILIKELKEDVDIMEGIRTMVEGLLDGCEGDKFKTRLDKLESQSEPELLEEVA